MKVYCLLDQISNFFYKWLSSKARDVLYLLLMS